MTISKRLLASSAVLMLGAGLLSACGSDAESTVAADCEPIAEVETVKDGVLTAAIAEFPPYIGAQGGKPTGIDGELLTEIAQNLCLELDLQVTSFPAITSALESGRADLSAGSWTINEERQAKFEVSDPVYLSLLSVVSADGWNTVDELEGKRVGTTTGYLWVDDVQQILGADSVRLYESEQAVYDDLKAGRLDAGLFTEGAVAYYMDSDGNPEDLENEVIEADDRIEMTVNEPATGVLIRKGSTDLLDAVNTVVAEMQTSGTLEELLTKAGISSESAVVPE
ncbi:amino acid ABC transporter substrate-binding protein [Aeromicrobium sp. YIM 150415]|uniref:substrate-binding periplasmic protein n=1 Tax=Aeromicrobium sp. YIM 150415 TaxID=2803912 RepID=UPI001962503B|nr:transporter substrate-binding domain-containing protein [Aeromicrobium sp. YIM 150415]MBM9463264.1 amino acid ABC transporter substrate-binding protein [Aeromicrobium sp. YIM 150415]